MSALHNQGRQSPSPSRWSAQCREIPGWTGQAEKQNGHAAAIYNPSAHTHMMVDPSGGGAGAAVGVGGTGAGGEGILGKGVEAKRGEVVLESNPVHPLEEAAKKKTERGRPGE
ncbi:hypothetical protein AJ80_04362 [Polytolypa hystricis UAMH7299]|uniref:Uncharacterized protein n=1 Tax=Polytolypa hystricis (strain UAMH7299) TaxID=1447883 RepID=A0A2B7YC98_POLH7|nr:hypothetical protein AJ80_04362 [Polytolypa hystricis UAMH7299]